jgi:hypothetical protein
MLDPKSIVTHNEYIVDRVGNRRQFDVVVRGVFAGHSALAVIECKDHNRKKGPDAVEAFARKAEYVGASIRIIVSRKGFTHSALRLARHDNICTLSLLPNDARSANLPIFIFWYGRVHAWEGVTLSLTFNGRGPSVTYSHDELLYQGVPFGAYFQKLLSNYRQVPDGTIVVEAVFSTPLPVSIQGHSFQLLRVCLEAARKTRNKRGRLRITGDGFWDWRTETAIIPSTGTVTVHGFHPDCADWEDLDVEFPPLGPYQLICDRYFDCIDENNHVPDLAPCIQSTTVNFTPSGS